MRSLEQEELHILTNRKNCIINPSIAFDLIILLNMTTHDRLAMFKLCFQLSRKYYLLSSVSNLKNSNQRRRRPPRQTNMILFLLRIAKHKGNHLYHMTVPILYLFTPPGPRTILLAARLLLRRLDRSRADYASTAQYARTHVNWRRWVELKFLKDVSMPQSTRWGLGIETDLTAHRI